MKCKKSEYKKKVFARTVCIIVKGAGRRSDEFNTFKKCKMVFYFDYF